MKTPAPLNYIENIKRMLEKTTIPAKDQDDIKRRLDEWASNIHGTDVGTDQYSHNEKKDAQPPVSHTDNSSNREISHPVLYLLAYSVLILLFFYILYLGGYFSH